MAVTEAQVISLMDAGFDRGLGGYPIMFADNGKVTIVQEAFGHVTVWEFDSDGSRRYRRYEKVEWV